MTYLIFPAEGADQARGLEAGHDLTGVGLQLVSEKAAKVTLAQRVLSKMVNIDGAGKRM